MASLQLKLQLLQCLQKNSLQQAKQLMLTISRTTQSNPQLYAKFHKFVQEHQAELNDSDSEDEVAIQSVDDQQLEEWNSQDEVNLSSDSEQEQFKEIGNKMGVKAEVKVESKGKKVFMVPTKPTKENASKGRLIKGK